MIFSVPTLQELLDRTRKAFRTFLPGSDAAIWPNNVNPTAKVIAGSVFEVFGFASYISRMIFASTAPDMETLKLHAAEYGLAQRPAYPASGTVRLTSTGDLTIDVGAVFARTDGVQYVASSSGSRVGAGTLDIAVTAMTAGAAGNIVSGAPVSIVSGAVDANGDATAETYGDIVGGADVEDAETFRARILFRKRNPPHGGAPADYVMWAGEVAGVSVTNGVPDVWVERIWDGNGTVRVFVLMRDLYENGIPPEDAIARVTDYLATVQPAGAIVTVAAPTAVPVDITVTGLSPDLAETREEVLASLREAFRRQARVAGDDTPHSGMPYLATPTSFSRSWIWQAVANASGEERHSITVPAADVALTAGQIAVLGDVTFA